MKHFSVSALGLIMMGFIVYSCVLQQSGHSDSDWVTLLDGSNLDNWTRTGNANWRILDGVAQADKGNGHLVSKNSYADFQLRAEFWVDADANSGIHFRCADPQKLGSATCYEVNIFDKRADAEYGTGAIVNVAKVSPMPKAGGRWNTVEITAKGPELTVIFNGARTAHVQDTKHLRGPITIQYAAGIVKFRRLEIKPL